MPTPQDSLGNLDANAALRQMRARWHQQWERWWEARLPPTDRATLTHRNIYILPTKAGWMMGLTLLVLLVTSINYQLNLGYLLTFLLGGCTAVGMVACHATLRGMVVSVAVPDAAFANEAVSLLVTLHNPSTQGRYGVGVALVDGAPSWIDVARQDSSAVTLRMIPAHRGWQRLPVLRVHTRFPLGFFEAWAPLRPASQLLVYPAPERPVPALPTGGSHDDEAASSISTPTRFGDPDGLRPYRRGDSLKTILWKKTAKTGELVSRDHSAAASPALWIDARDTGLPGHAGSAQREAQLSRMCAWVLEAERRSLHYGLRLGAEAIPPNTGPAHERQCLRVLALG